MSFTSKLTNLAAAGVGGETFWRLELYNSSSDMALNGETGNEIVVLSDGSIIMAANKFNDITDQCLLKISAEGELVEANEYASTYTSTSSPPRSFQNLTYDSVNDKGVMSHRALDQNTSNVVAAVSGVSSNGRMQAIYRKDDANDNYRTFQERHQGVGYYWSGGEYFYTVGKLNGTDYLYVFDTSNGMAPVYRIAFSGHNGIISHMAGRGNKLALADDRYIHLLNLNTNGTVSVAWSKYLTNGQAGSASTANGGDDVVCHINDDNDVLYFGFNRERTTVFRLSGTNGAKESSKDQVENSSTKLNLFGSKYVTSSGSTDGGRLWGAGGGTNIGDGRLYYQLNGNGYNWIKLNDPHQTHAHNFRQIGIDPNTNATIIGSYCYDANIEKRKLVIYRLPDFHTIRTASSGSTIATFEGGGNLVKSNISFSYYTTDSVYEPVLNNNTLTVSATSNTSEFGYKGSPTRTALTLNETTTEIST